MKKKSLVTIIVILAVIVLAAVILTRSNPTPPKKETAICIGENSKLFTQLGCHACEIQEDIFGDNYEYLNVVDCFFEREECIESNIKGTPTWIINGEQYLGSHSLNQLKELTGC